MKKDNLPFSFLEKEIKFFQQNLKQVGIIFFLVILISLLFPGGETLKYSYKINDITREPIIAPYTFPILKTEADYEEDKKIEKQSVSYIFNRDQGVSNSQLKELDKFFKSINDYRSAKWRFNESKQLYYERKYHPTAEKAKNEFIADSTSLVMIANDFKNDYPFTTLKDSSWNNYLTTIDNPRTLNDLSLHQKIVNQICKNRWSEGIYDISIDSIISDKVKINQGDVPILTKKLDFNSLEVAWIKAKEEYISKVNLQDIFFDIGYDIIVEHMIPNLIYDRELTESNQRSNIKQVPRSKGVVLENELIVDANIRITEDVLQKLNSLSTSIDNLNEDKPLDDIWNYLGRIILLLIVISLFFTFLYMYRIDVFSDWKMILLMSIIILFQMLLASLIINYFQFSEYLVPVSVGALTLTILFDARIGFMSTVAVSILVGLMMGQNIDFVITSLFISTVGVYNIRELRKRSQLFTTMFALIGASVIVIIAIGLFKEQSWSNIIIDLQILTLNSFLAPIITYGLIGLTEMAFEVTTDLTLIELLDYDRPLLKRAQRETNGTFNHSIVVGNLAEACATAIGAHSLLCRVGAYYHDIGKMIKADYFIENQYASDNKHDAIKPTMSAKIIRSHVNNGLQLAKEYGLPKIVSDFIPMHHGTTRVEYFYRQALDAVDGDESKIDESQFRYPGPKPNTKETGILMICEAIEAAVRSIKNPDIMKIENMIDKIIKQRVDDGQLSDCPLTLDELDKIKGTVDGNTGMLHVLRGIYHIRIEYPDDK
ncbi:MAG: HD family phosphohydrolase [Candidatus Neomarinimicrobiota bacterium]